MKTTIRIVAFIICFGNALHGAVYYLDPVNGSITNDGSLENPWSSLEEVIDANMISSNSYNPLPYDAMNSELSIKNPNGVIGAGDTLLLMEGLHGEIFLRGYYNSDMITIKGFPGHIATLRSIQIQAGRHWRFENLTISAEPYETFDTGKLVYFQTHSYHGPCSKMEILDCDIHNGKEPWNTLEQWLTNVGDGIYMRGDSMIAIGNTLTNTDMGITAAGNNIVASNNQVINFTGDGMRMLGSNIVFESNLIKNCYDVDDNHDDGIQSFTSSGNPFENNVIRSNTIINYEDPNQLFRGTLQGIGCFDGFYNNWIIENNVINVDHWHGITLMGANDCTIINNTVIDPSPDETPGPSWIRIADHKDGTPSTGCVVKNNISNNIIVDAINDHNIIASTYEEYNIHFIDYSLSDFRLKPDSDCIDGADSGFAPSLDILGNPRNVGLGPDIGAYEFQALSSINSSKYNKEIVVYPNPFSDFSSIRGTKSGDKIIIYDTFGRLMSDRSLNGSAIGGDLKKGSFYLKVLDRNDNLKYSNVIIKI